MRREKLTTLTGEIIRTTEKAILFRAGETEQQYWIPRSVCLDGDTLSVADSDVIIETWWLEKNS